MNRSDPWVFSVQCSGRSALLRFNSVTITEEDYRKEASFGDFKRDAVFLTESGCTDNSFIGRRAKESGSGTEYRTCRPEY
jgi:hypothetical protein